MLRNILVLVIGIIALAVVRNLVREVGKLVSGSMGFKKTPQAQEKTARSPRRKLVQDPHTGTYIDPVHAVKAKVGGTIHYFESEATRDAYVTANT